MATIPDMQKHAITNYNGVSFWKFSIWIGIGLVVMVFLMRIRKASEQLQARLVNKYSNYRFKDIIAATMK
ncbi:MAG TPA: hypothetical protein VN703_07295 [Candidatus Sulfopaludibacter sp.]|nr:hypothetical protein [Candidatus Sulfopaludibacter sp.]